VTSFPGHWAPNGLTFYRGAMFPAKYQNGAFIAFHGSWNRAPHP
jgi:glucose/arabinose dehydrogenase